LPVGRARLPSRNPASSRSPRWRQVPVP
jgi:hypothetical protein